MKDLIEKLARNADNLVGDLGNLVNDSNSPATDEQRTQLDEIAQLATDVYRMLETFSETL